MVRFRRSLDNSIQAKRLRIAVQYPTWKASYDIRVDMQAKEKPVKLIYKAAITQSTGEVCILVPVPSPILIDTQDWNDVPLTLETASPTFGVGIPDLQPWRLSVYQPAPLIPRMHPADLGAVASTAEPRLYRRAKVSHSRSFEPGKPLCGYTHFQILD